MTDPRTPTTATPTAPPTATESAPTASCPHHGPCPGCPLLSESPPRQAELKRQRVEKALSPYPALAALALAPLTSIAPTFGYRTRAKWRIGKGGSIGLFAAGTHDVVDLLSCGVVRPPLRAAAEALRQLMRDPAAPRWLKSTEDGGALSAIDLREVIDAQGESRVLAMLVLDADIALRELELFAPRLRDACPAIVSVAAHRRLQHHTVLGGDTQLLLGPLELPDRILAKAPPFLATHGAFVQAHRGVAGALLERIAGAIRRPDARVLELFAGSGALSLVLARAGHRVLAVESFGPAMDRLRRAASDAQLGDRIEAVAADATFVAQDLAKRQERFDVVVVNPPRTGLRPELRVALAALAPTQLFYVSCEPRTLARDLSDLGHRGYAPRASGGVTPFDMMPATAQVETLVELTTSAPTALNVLHEDPALLVVDKPPHLHPSALLARVRSELLAPEATALSAQGTLVEEGMSGLCLFARTPADAPALSAALAAAQKRYLVLLRGVPHQKGKIARPLKDGARMRDATTRYTRFEIAGGHALMEVRPVEGVPHQIQKHLASIERPVLGDDRFGHEASNIHLYERFGLDRPFIHLHRIELERDGVSLALKSELAPDLGAVLEELRASRA